MNVIRPCRYLVFAAAGWLAIHLAGCGSRDEPRRYQEPQAQAPVPGRPLAARDAAATAPSAQCSAESPALCYDTPKGWTAGSAGGMRKAAFIVQEGDRKVEITVIDLAAQAGALLPNVNRWRQQIGLPDTTQSELDKSLVRLAVADVEGAYVELLGPEAAGHGARQAILGVVAIRGGQAWFVKLWGDAKLATREKSRFREFVKSVRFEAAKNAAAPPASPKATASPPAPSKDEAAVSVVTVTDEDSPPLEYEAPKGWTPDESEGAGRLAFHVADGDRKVDVAVMHLPGSIEKMLLNVNRWRHEIQLSEIAQADLDKMLQPIPVGGKEGQYVELVGPDGSKPRLATLIVVVNFAKKSWMFRMTGDADLALREKEHFQQFVKSFQLPAEQQKK